MRFNRNRSAAITTIICFIAAMLLLVPVIANKFTAPKWQTYGDFKSYYAMSSILRGPTPSQTYEEAVMKKTVVNFFPEAVDPRANPPPLQVFPFALPLILPISLVPAKWSCDVWTAILLLCTVAATLILSRREKMSSRSTAIVLLLVAASGPYHSLIRLGELAPIGLLCLSLAFICLQRKNACGAGVLLSLMLMKPHWVLPFLAYLFGCRRFKVLAWLGLSTFVLAAVAYVSFGAETFSNYLPQAKHLSENPLIFSVPEAVSLTAQIYRLMPRLPYASIMPFTALIYCCSLLFLCWLGNRYRDNRDWLTPGIICAFPLGISCAFYYSPYDIIFVLPSLLALFGQTNFSTLPASSKTLICLSALVLMNPLYHWIMGKLSEGFALPFNPIYAGVLVLSVVAVRFCLTEKANREVEFIVPPELPRVSEMSV